MIQKNLDYRDDKEETNEVIIADEFEEDYIITIFDKLGKFDNIVISCTNTHKNYAERIIRKFFCLGLLPKNDELKIDWETVIKDVINKKGQKATSEINSITLYKRENLTKFTTEEPDIYDAEIQRVIIADKPEKIYIKRILDISQKSNQILISCINTYIPNAERIVNKCFTAGFHPINKKLQIQWEKSIGNIINKKGQNVVREINKIKLIKDDTLYKYIQ